MRATFLHGIISSENYYHEMMVRVVCRKLFIVIYRTIQSRVNESGTANIEDCELVRSK